MLLSAAAVTYAKYLESESLDEQGTVGAASFSAKIDGISALSFTNTAFWGGTAAEDKVAMNALRSIDFSISNFETDDDGNVTSVNSVKSTYDLTFTAPANFVEKLAIQVIGADGAAIMPQIVLSEVLEGKDFNTADSEDFTATEADDVQFAVSETGGIYTAASDDITITLTPKPKMVEQTLYFRLWDTSKLTAGADTTIENEGGELLAPVCVTIKEQVKCYAISVNLPEKFVLPANTETTHNYVMRLAPTDTLSDEHLGGVLMTKTTENNVDTYSIVTSLYGGQNLYMVTTEENVVDSDPDATAYPSDPDPNGWYTVLGNVKKYSVGNTTTVKLDPVVNLEGPTVVDGTPTSSTVRTYDIYYYDGDGNIIDSATQTGQSSIPTDRPNNNASSRRIVANYTETTEQINTATSTLTKTEAVETITTDEISADGNTINQTVSKESTVATTTTTTTTTNTTTTTWTQTRTDSWQSSGNNRGSWTAGSWGAETDKNATTTSNTETSAPTNTQKTTSEFMRTIFRRSSEVEVNTQTVSRVTEVKTEIVDGNVINTEIVEKYTSSSPFSIFATAADDVSRQIFFISQCYSKNYPMTVDVKFRQIN